MQPEEMNIGTRVYYNRPEHFPSGSILFSEGVATVVGIFSNGWTEIHCDNGFRIAAPRENIAALCQPIICPECGFERPDDDRVRAGMKCGECAY